jgi:hypothetical protein
MQCIYCGADTEVKDSRLTTANSVRRLRKCLSCFRKFTTYEVIVGKDAVATAWFKEWFAFTNKIFKINVDTRTIDFKAPSGNVMKKVQKILDMRNRSNTNG